MILQRSIPYIFAFTLFLSATLVFSVQPMLGKMMLPHVGGAPSGWAVTMFFFQTCLLFGYGLAYIFSKLPPLLNTFAILFMFIPAALFLPIAYQSGIADSISPWGVFMQLTLSTAIPFLALSTLAPGLQRLFSFSTHKTAGDPYYLYAASNIGSFVGLLAYPFIFEPLIGLKAQSHIWMIAFGLLFICVLICGYCVFVSRRDLINFKFSSLKLNNNQNDVGEIITWSRRSKWLLLAAIPSSLMIGTTTKITTDIASAPMIWVLPLSLYLLTNIIAFAKRNKFNISNLAAFHVISVIVIIMMILFESYLGNFNNYAILFAFVYMATFTITALLLHCQLANDRPQTNKLTEFFLIMALGGALGGSLNAFVAPSLFNDVYEFQFVFILSLLLSPAFYLASNKQIKKISIILIFSTIALLTGLKFFVSAAIVSIVAFVILMSAVHAKTLFTISLIIILFLASPWSKKDVTYIDRNFFGVVKVLESKLQDKEDYKVRTMQHGTTLHGFEALDEKHAYIPYSYYGFVGPMGDIINISNPKDVAVLGLGTGQMACHKQKNRAFTFYEIDPHVIDVAKKYFTLLKECGYKDIILGDARLELNKSKEKYDLIVVDTFSSDAIPIHLITSEAIQLYMSKLKNNGVVTINISNRHLDLNEPLAAIAHDNDYFFRTRFYNTKKEDAYNFASEWVVITKNKNFISSLDKKGWRDIETTMRPWTDDYSNFISTLKIFHKNNESVKTEKDKE